MTLNIPGVRVALISDTTSRALGELLPFRHFKRYYFQLEYDWDRLDFLTRKYEEAYSAILHHFEDFGDFLRDIADDT
jgi:hypothetical protein